MTTGPDSSCQLPRGSTRTVRGLPDVVTSALGDVLEQLVLLLLGGRDLVPPRLERRGDRAVVGGDLLLLRGRPLRGLDGQGRLHLVRQRAAPDGSGLVVADKRNRPIWCWGNFDWNSRVNVSSVPPASPTGAAGSKTAEWGLPASVRIAQPVSFLPSMAAATGNSAWEWSADVAGEFHRLGLVLLAVGQRRRGGGRDFELGQDEVPVRGRPGAARREVRPRPSLRGGNR